MVTEKPLSPVLVPLLEAVGSVIEACRRGARVGAGGMCAEAAVAVVVSRTMEARRAIER